jgi:transcriptional regulator with XRE-family HTH domain
MATKKMKKTRKICIGERIKEIFDQKSMSITQFAELLRCDRANVYNIFRRKKIDIDLLLRISQTLNHNFIEEVCAEYGVQKEISASKITFAIEINSIDTKTLRNFFKILKQLEIITISERTN